MKNIILFSVFYFIISNVIFSQTSDQISSNSCIKCHTENDNLPEDYHNYNIHNSVNIFCNDCHGGNPNSDEQEIAMSKKYKFIGVPDKKTTLRICSKCHSNIDYMKKYNPRIETDQYKRYLTSIHGKQLLKGDENVAVCSDCHSAHSILKSEDPRSSTYPVNVPTTCNKCHGNKDLMNKYNLESIVFADFSISVHGKKLLKDKDINAPACNDCHGNHGATPPGIKSIAYVCGNCHVNNMNYFKNSRMGIAFIENDFHGCVECHGNHKIQKPDDNFVGTSEQSSCMQCHEIGDNGANEADSIHLSIVSLKSKIDSANTLANEVRKRGMDDLEIIYSIKDARQELIKSRTAVHTFDKTKVKEITKNGESLIAKAINMANEEIDDYYVRRNGFAFSTIIITILIIALYFKIKDMEKKKV